MIKFNHTRFARFAVAFPVASVLAGAALVVICFLIWLMNINQLDLRIAYEGYTPLTYVYKTIFPENFVKDFPGGTEIFNISLSMHVYKLLFVYCGIPPELSIYAVIGVQIALLAIAQFFFFRSLFRNTSRVPALILVITVLGSYGRDMDFSRYGQPLPALNLALYYNISEALCLFSASIFLRKKYIISSLTISVAYCIYPTIAVLWILFLLSVSVKDLWSNRSMQLFIGVILFIVLAGAWTLFMILPESVAGTYRTIPDKLWFDLTKLSSYHLYPVEYGLFSKLHEERFIPFLSFLMLLSYYIGKLHRLREEDERIIVGLFALLALTIIGVIISCITPGQFLVKLNLSRSSSVFIAIGLMYVIKGAWEELETSPIWRKVVVSMVLISPFVLHPGYPLLWSLVLTSPAWVNFFKKKGGGWPERIVVVLSAGTVLLIIIYCWFGFAEGSAFVAYTGGRHLIREIIPMAVVLSALFCFQGSLNDD